MFTILSLVTSVKDYVEIVHKLIESDPTQNLTNYYDLGAITTYIVLLTKNVLTEIFSFQWLQNASLLPIFAPSVAKSMISEISVLDGYFHNALTFLETPLSYGNNNIFFYCLEKFGIGLINSLFLCLPTSIAHLICLRRFVMQGLEAGYIAGLGTIAGNVLWIGSVVLGFRFIVIPWLSFDLLRYFLGFILLIKYMWDSYTEKKFVLDDISKSKIFLLNFLLAFTEQTNLYPFISNLSISSNSTILESFPATNSIEFFAVHIFYLVGIVIGSLSLLQFTCWFWENPAFNIYMWLISSFKVTTNVYYQFVNFTFLYLTMICAMSSVAYFGLDYTLTNPIGFVHEDRLLDQKNLIETAFLNTKASDRNTRRNRGRHGRRERWKRRVRRYRTFDVSLYDQGVYDLFTIEDLNYGFDRFWLRRKMRNHGVRFRFFPGPWMRSFKKQLSKPRLESFMGPRVEFFRILFEQVYHPEFHEYQKNDSRKIQTNSNLKKPFPTAINSTELEGNFLNRNDRLFSIYSNKTTKTITTDLIKENSALRKFLRKVDTRIQISKVLNEIQDKSLTKNNIQNSQQLIYSKRWKHLFSKSTHDTELQSSGTQQALWKQFRNQILATKPNSNLSFFERKQSFDNLNRKNISLANEKENSLTRLSKKDRQVLRYKSFLQTLNSNSTKTDTSNPVSTKFNNLEGLKSSEIQINPRNKLDKDKNSLQSNSFTSNQNFYKPLTLLHPLKFYMQKEKAFQRKLKFYGVNIFRNFDIENNAPYFRIMMKKFFYHYKPTLRWERTMRTATLRKARRKNARIVRKMSGQNDYANERINKNTKVIANLPISAEVSKTNLNQISSDPNQPIKNEANFDQIQKPTHFYSLVNKRANRYRYQIYKDVLQHWYYSPFNRLLLKFDVDSFIRRQPKAHFLTKKEEHLLHLKRFLLAEHYETLRWYTYMQHYRLMKTKIGGTKSFASRVYNQQFQGTFKKIRHLFAITPSATSNVILKFDQPLYNEFPNQTNSSILEQSFMHEELLADDLNYGLNASMPEDLISQSSKIIREYLKTTNPIRRELMIKLLEDKNYWELANFLYKGQKTRGTMPITNQNSLIQQENTYLHLNSENNPTPIDENSILNPNFSNLSEDLWISLIKKCQNQLYNQESLKLYLSRHMEKHQRQKQQQEKLLKSRLERIKDWLIRDQSMNSTQKTIEFKTSLKSSIQKAIKETIFTQKGVTTSKMNIRNNNPTLNLAVLKNDSKQSKTKNIQMNENLKTHLYNRTKSKVLQNVLIEEDLKNSFNLINQQIQKRETTDPLVFAQRYEKLKRILTLTLFPLNYISNLTTQKVLKPTFKSVKSIFDEKPNKDLNFWRKQEILLSKRKKMRKKLDRLTTIKRKEEKTLSVDGFNNFNSELAPLEEPNRQKIDKTMTFNKNENQKNKKTWLNYQNNLVQLSPFEQEFKRKRSRARLKSPARRRERIKKRTLADKLRRQFRLLKKYGQSQNREDKKIEIFQLITKRKYEPDSSFTTREIKQQRTRQRKHRVWKKNKKQKYAQNRRKERKRRRYAIGKIRNLNKKLKHVKNQLEIKKWWWQTFLPNFKGQSDAMIQIQNDQSMQEKLSKLSVSELLELDNQIHAGSIEFVENQNKLQIGNKDYKPLSIPEAIRIRENLAENGKLNFTNPKAKLESLKASESTNVLDEKPTFSSKQNVNTENQNNKTTQKQVSIINQISQNLLVPENSTVDLTNSNKFLVGVNPIPFYAGWDESLRKFVITNRLLSRNDASYQMSFNNIIENSVQNSNSNKTLSTEEKNQVLSKTYPGLKNLFNKIESKDLEFTQAPLKGMNAATTLYWQIPFTTYDPDQFFALGMDGFSPVNWRRFNFKYSKETTKPILVKMKTLATNDFNNSTDSKTKLSYNIQMKLLNTNLVSESKSKTNISHLNKVRRTQKRYKRVKKHPRPPVWFPSGSLTNQVLPVHYIYVFYKRSRLPRDRYMSRRLRRNKDSFTSGMQPYFTTLTDFTLRKRIKPKRKYHRKRIFRKTENLLLKRRAFRGFLTETKSIRPLSKTQLLSQPDSQTLQFKSKQRRKSKTNKQQSDNIRIRQLRRRIQRQVLRPISRYKPKAGGFIWPGDYLRLELVDAPKLHLAETGDSTMKSESNVKVGQKNIRKKKRKRIQEWQIQPKKYLLEKHNLRVLKNRLQKSQNLHKIGSKVNLISLIQ